MTPRLRRAAAGGPPARRNEGAATGIEAARVVRRNPRRLSEVADDGMVFIMVEDLNPENGGV
jgi:hypothetical protein